MKLLSTLIIFFVINVNFSKGKSCVSEAAIFKTELDTFISTVSSGGGYSLKYIVYVANIYTYSNSDFCFTLGYILNDYEVKYIDPEFIYLYKGEIVLIRAPQGMGSKFMNELGLKKIKSEEWEVINKKLLNKKDGAFTYSAAGFNYCSENGIVQEEYFPRADLIPLEISIWGNFPDNMIIEKIE